MTVYGTIKNGVVVLPDAACLPEGAPVRVDTLDAPLAELADLAEAMPDDPQWPPDGAAEHDHYLYGTPKRGR